MTVYVVYRILNHRDKDVDIVSVHVTYDAARQAAERGESSEDNKDARGGTAYHYYVSDADMKQGFNMNDMTKSDALRYCHRHRKQFIMDCSDLDEGIRQFDCLVALVESGHVKPSQLPDYGMDYEDAPSKEG